MAIFMMIDALKGLGEVQVEGYADGNWFKVNSFSFGVEREMKESGEKGGTEDINIGVGELQECTISKHLDRTSTSLAQFAINGNSLGTGQIDFVELAGGEGQPICYLRYKLDRCFVKSWSTSGDADDRPTEEVAFYYNKIAFNYTATKPVFSWDRTRNRVWADHKLPPIEGQPR